MTLGQWLIGIKDKITDLASRITSLEVDYIVEEGTSGIWTYRKWSSGLSECWTTNIVSSGTHTMTQNGALYESDTHEYDFPANLFTDRPTLSVNVQQGGGMWAKATGSTTALTAQIGFLRTNDNTGSINFNMEAKGSWISGDLRLLGTENEEPISSENGLMLSLGGASPEAIPISDLPSVSSLTGATIFPVVLDGTTYNTTLSVILNHTHTKSQITDFPAIPTKTSDLTNDSGFITQNNVDDVKVDGTSVLTNRIANINLSGKMDDFTKQIYVGSSGNPRSVKFLTVDYNSAGSETGVSIKISLVGGHGNGSSYVFLEDAFIGVTYLGGVSVNNMKYYESDTGATYEGKARKYGDIFWIINTTSKIVDFYVLAGQWSYLKMTPYKRLNTSTGGTITQYTSATIYSSGTRNWGYNDLIATAGDLASKISEPSAEGTSGQVLATNGSGGRYWTTAGGGGTYDYSDLNNKPKINNVELNGNKSSADLGLAADSNVLHKTGAETITGNKTFTGGLSATGHGATIQGRINEGGDDEGLLIQPASNNYAGLILGTTSAERTVLYHNNSTHKAWLRRHNGTSQVDMYFPHKAGTFALAEDCVTLDTEQKITAKKTISLNEGSDGQASALKVLSPNESTSGLTKWLGRLLAGAKNKTFLMGVYNGLCGLGAHSWTDAEAQTGAAWEDVHIQPDGNKATHIGGVGWNGYGWLKVDNADGKVYYNKGTGSAPNYKEVATKEEIPSLNGYATQSWVEGKGYGTYSKPSSGIPASDLAQSYYLASNPNGYTDNTVANSKYTKPSSGIPKSDLASSVQTSLGLADTALQSHQSLANYYTKTETDSAISGHHDSTKQDVISDLATIRSGASAGATAVQPEAGKGLFSGNYNDLTNKPTIPSKTSQLTNDSGYLTAHQDISGKLDKTSATQQIIRHTNGEATPVVIASDANGTSYVGLVDKGNTWDYLGKKNRRPHFIGNGVGHYLAYEDELPISGARNLFSWSVYNGNAYEIDYSEAINKKAIKLPQSSDLVIANSTSLFDRFEKGLMKDGDIYTVSFMATADGDTTLYFDFWPDNWAGAYGAVVINVGTTAKRYVTSGPLDWDPTWEGRTDPYEMIMRLFRLNTDPNYAITIWDIKIEKGDSDTGYMLSPEDVESSFVHKVGNEKITAMSGDTPLNLQSKDSNAYLGFKNNAGTTLGYIGVNGSKKPVFYDTAAHTIPYVGSDNAMTIGSSIIRTNGYLEGTWLRTSAATALGSASQYAVIQNGWIYYVTPETMANQIGALAGIGTAITNNEIDEICV